MKTSQELWEATTFPRIENEEIEAACKQAQLFSIREKIERFTAREEPYDNDWIRNYILGYFDTCTFYGHLVKQSSVRDLTGYLNRQASKGAIIKCHTGAGSYSRYVFPKSILSSMIDDVFKELGRI